MIRKSTRNHNQKVYIFHMYIYIYAYDARMYVCIFYARVYVPPRKKQTKDKVKKAYSSNIIHNSLKLKIAKMVSIIRTDI